MKIAIIGSRDITVPDLEPYLPENTTEIISGGARGADACAKAYALAHHIAYREFLPDYTRYGRGAPIVRNRLIVEAADEVIAFWNGTSRGTRSVIDYCRKIEKPVTVILTERADVGFTEG